MLDFSILKNQTWMIYKFKHNIGKTDEFGALAIV